MKEQILKNKAYGITIIALVITIVVLLILAGVTISVVFSENGIISQAQKTKERQEIAVLKDQVEIIKTAWELDRSLNDNIGIENLWQRLIDAKIISGTDKIEETIEDGESEKYILNTIPGYKIDLILSGDIKKDTTPPTATISLGATSANTGENVTATVTHNDNESGPEISGCKWVYNTNSGTEGTNSSSYTGTFSSNGETINLNASLPGSYYLHVLTVDKAGNMAETINGPITVEKLVADGKYNSTKGINTPKLGTGMTAIKWNGSTWADTTGDDTEWYDYSNKKWANAKTSDGSMWVWIPRYAYQITSNYHNGGLEISGNINIKFMKGTTNEASDGKITWDNTSGQGNWNIHPGFEYGNTVPGIWIAKFEASHSDASSSSTGSSSILKIQQGVQSWRNISISNVYSTCLNYNTTLNSHMMKNSEWGAVAYLAQSTYGKNSEVGVNECDSYVTGMGPGGSEAVTNGSYSYNTNHTYQTTQGQKASTTGNVTGIYDMSGGNLEYVAAYVNNTYVQPEGSSYTPGINLIKGAAKTKDIYIMGTTDTRENNYTAAANVYGNAVYETSPNQGEGNSWYGDSPWFPYGESSFISRGGYYKGLTSAGLFCFSNAHGWGYEYVGFRPVLIVL